MSTFTTFLLHFVHLTVLVQSIVGLSCGTVEFSPYKSKGDAEALQYFISKNKWPNGIVKYHFNKSLLAAYPLEKLVKSAFTEYHTKTCLRFEEKSSTDINYVSIEFEKNPYNVAGEAEVCMKGGYQYLKIGESGKNVETIIHEMGHTICLSHEHLRNDRDKYITINMDDYDCKDQNYTIKDRPVHGLYNYASQMHYACGACIQPKNKNVPGCGDKVTKGLSVLDADYINDLYDCQGCFGHRWRSIKSLKDKSMSDLFFSRLNKAGIGQAYPCRVSVDGSILVGTYKQHSNACTVLENEKVKIHTDNFEVLYVLTLYKYQYLSIDERDSVLMKDMRENFAHAVPGGFDIFESESDYKSVYVGQGVVSMKNGIKETVFGWVKMNKSGIHSGFVVNKMPYRFYRYAILGCYPDGPSSSSYFPEINGAANYFKRINETLSNKAKITISGKFRGNFQVYFLRDNEITCQFDFYSTLIEYKVRQKTGEFKPFETILYHKFVPGKEFVLEVAFQKRSITIYIDNVIESSENLNQTLLMAKYLLIKNLNVIDVDTKYEDDELWGSAESSPGNIVTLIYGFFAVFLVVCVCACCCYCYERRKKRLYFV